MTFFALTTILFLIMDPVGNIPSALTLVGDLPPRRRNTIIFREMLIALAIMVLFFFLGDFILDVLQVSAPTTRIASGAILFLIAIKILFPSTDSLRANLPQGEPLITPLAIPLIAGPGAIATIMLFSHLENRSWILLAAILTAWLAALIILLSGFRLQKLIGSNGLLAAERLMGMVLVMLGLQRLLEGLQHFIKANN